MKFCSDVLWNRSESWDTNDPVFTDCFHNIILQLLPSIFFFLLSGCDLFSQAKSLHISAGWCTRLRICLTIGILSIRTIDTVPRLAILVTHLIDGNGDHISISQIIAPAVELVAWTYCLLMMALVMKKRFTRSAAIWIFVVSSLSSKILSIISDHNNRLKQMEKTESDWYSISESYIELILLTILTIVCSIAEKPTTSDEQEVKGSIKSESTAKFSPRDYASIPSCLFYCWCYGLAITGFRKNVTPDDLHQLGDDEKAQDLDTRLGNQLIKKNGTEGSTVYNNVIISLFKAFKWQFVELGFIKLLSDSSDLLKPLLLKWLLTYTMHPNEMNQQQWHAYLILILMISDMMIYTKLNNMHLDSAAILASQLRSSLRMNIYRKSMKLNPSARKDRTIGEVMNLISVDANKFHRLLIFLNNCWTSVIQFTAAIIILYLEVGNAAIAALLVLIILVAINASLTLMTQSIQRKQMDHSDERIKCMSEMVTGIKVIKLNAWENALMAIISRIRDLEFRCIRLIVYSRSIIPFLWAITVHAMALATFTYIYINDSDDDVQTLMMPERVFFCLALFNCLRLPVSEFPQSISTLISLWISLKRINEFFGADSLEGYAGRHDDINSLIIMNDCCFSWEGEEREDEKHNGDDGGKQQQESNGSKNFSLQIDSLRIPNGSLVAVVGVVGSGKTSLLSAILQEMQLQSGSMTLYRDVKKIAYVPQHAWMQNDTVKGNIEFGMPFDAYKYLQVIQSCELESDLRILSAGDETEIGEKGINLSGGQKQRISIARASYSDADLYLFDDPLSAVDANVAVKLFTNVFSSQTGILKGKTRILVTNNLSFLNQVDQIVILEDGKITQFGSYDEIMAGGLLTQVLSQVTQQRDDVDAVDAGHGDDDGDADIVTKLDIHLAPRVSVCVADEAGVDDDRGRLIQDEKQESGSVKLVVFINYFSQMFLVFLIPVAFVASQVCETLSAYWLSRWTRDYLNNNCDTNATAINICSSSINDNDNNNRPVVYAILVSCFMILTLGACLWFARGAIDAGRKMHDALVYAIFRSPMTFFETTPLGRILNRFSYDMDVIDSQLSEQFISCIIYSLYVIGCIVLILASVPLLIIMFIILTTIVVVIQKIYITSARQIRRLDATVSSKILAHASESIAGISTIRSYGSGERFVCKFENLIDTGAACTQSFYDLSRFRGLMIAISAIMITFFTGFAIIYLDDSVDPTLKALALVYTLNLNQIINYLTLAACFIESESVTLERVMEYSANEPEADWNSDPEHKPPSDWPMEGRIRFQNYETRYREGLDLVIRGIDAEISAGEKIGIVGRTGAGKSSITLAIFRLIEPSEGKIYIDDIDTTTIGLYDLRSRITIISQDPFLLSGSLRSNLDPFDQKTDQEVWTSLRLSHLKTFVSSLDGGLNYRISECGSNLSAGQRQLMCLARALLRKSKILVLDEATAAVDVETDALIQSTIRQEFTDCTIITIAHRLNTILGSDRVLVMQDGRIAEFDEPKVLLDDAESVFHSLAVSANVI